VTLRTTDAFPNICIQDEFEKLGGVVVADDELLPPILIFQRMFEVAASKIRCSVCECAACLKQVRSLKNYEKPD